MNRREDEFDTREDELLGAMMRVARQDEPAPPEFSRMLERARYEVHEREAASTPWMALVAGALLALGFAILYQTGPTELPVTEHEQVERASAAEVQRQLAREERASVPKNNELMTWEAPTDFLLAGPLDDESGLMSDAPSFGEASL